ncbi:MAG: thiamine-phosphate kinase [Proteobacteria bacterium]|nr:MAG: thiamine-phosphate kinase [Pseudomonadota bacterium]
MREFELIDGFFSALGARRDDVILGVGDDAAIIAPDTQASVVCTDTLVAGVHFESKDAGGDVGFKSLAVNLSDLAAMGAEPVWATVNLTIPGFDEIWIRDFCAGLNDLALRYGVAIVGGDTTRGPLTITVQAGGRVPVDQALSRSGARPGQRVYLSGPIGDGALGLKVAQGDHRPRADDASYLLSRLRRPEPAIDAGRALRGVATSAIDISDGLLADLGHVLRLSGGYGAELVVSSSWFSSPVCRYVEAGGDIGVLISGGDDYVLACTVDEADAGLFARRGSKDALPWVEIGRVVTEPGIRVRDPRGRLVDITVQGYQHF